MSKHKPDPLLEALKEGRSYSWTVPEGGNLASMRKAIRHGQMLTMAPVSAPGELKPGDMVLVKWHASLIFHLIGDIQGDRYLIVNSLGGENGWVGAEAILGRITQVVDPEPRPDLETLLLQLETTYQALAGMGHAGSQEVQMLAGIVADLRWYAMRLGAERLDEMPRSNKWSFMQNLWQLVRQARQQQAQAEADLLLLIDRGKQCVGLAAENHALFNYPDPE